MITLWWSGFVLRLISNLTVHILWECYKIWKKNPALFSNYLATSKQSGTWKSNFFGFLRKSELYFVLNWEKDAQVTWCSLILRILQQSHMRAHNSQGIEGLLFGGHNGWFWGQLLPYLVKVDATKAAIIIVYDATTFIASTALWTISSD